MLSNKFLQVLQAVALFATVLLSQGLVAQQNEENTANKELKRDFVGITLGQSLDEFRSQLKDDGEARYYFLYDLDTSEIGGGSQTLIEVKGNGYVEKGVFQFVGFEDEPRLVAITIFLAPKWNSYDQFFAKFSSDYGRPSSLTPQHSTWENEQTIITLEKTLRYKIIDKEYLVRLQEQDQKKLDLYEYSYEEFLKKF